MQEVFLKDLADVDHHIQEKCWHVFPAFNRSKRYKYPVCARTLLAAFCSNISNAQVF